MKQTFVQTRSEVMVTSTTSKYFLQEGLQNGGLISELVKGFFSRQPKATFRQKVMTASITSKKLLAGGFTLGGLNVRIYRRTFPSPIKYSEISWGGFTNHPLNVGISEGTFNMILASGSQVTCIT